MLPWMQAGVPSLGARLLMWLAWPGSQQAELGNDSRGAARDDGGQGSSHLVLGFLCLFLDRFSAGRGQQGVRRCYGSARTDWSHILVLISPTGSSAAADLGEGTGAGARPKHTGIKSRWALPPRWCAWILFWQAFPRNLRCSWCVRLDKRCRIKSRCTDLEVGTPGFHSLQTLPNRSRFSSRHLPGPGYYGILGSQSG